eukprot:scaffold732_cov48-Attheya_sp.AAC.3
MFQFWGNNSKEEEPYEAVPTALSLLEDSDDEISKASTSSTHFLDDPLLKVRDDDPELTKLHLSCERKHGNNDGSQEPIFSQGAVALALALKHNTNIVSLDLSFNMIGNEGASALASALCENDSIRILNLEGNFIRSSGAAAIAEALCQNSRLRSISLKNNPLEDEGAIEIAGGLGANRSLRTLDLSHAGIANEGAMFLSQALTYHRKLNALYLDHNDIGDAGANSIADATIRCNMVMRILGLNHNKIGDEGMQSIALACRKNSQLRSIYLNDNSACLKTSILHMIQALRYNHTISTILMREYIVQEETSDISNADEFLNRLIIANRRGPFKAAKVKAYLDFPHVAMVYDLKGE